MAEAGPVASAPESAIGHSKPGTEAESLWRGAEVTPFLGIQDVEGAIVIELHPGDDLDQPVNLLERIAHDRRDAPEMGRRLLAPREHGPAVGAERNEPDLALVPVGRTDGLARGLVPELGRPIVTARHDDPVIGADGQGADRSVMSQGWRHR